MNDVDFRRIMREFKQLNTALRSLAQQARAGVPYNVLQPQIAAITSRFDTVRQAILLTPESPTIETWTFTVDYQDGDDAGLPPEPGEEREVEPDYDMQLEEQWLRQQDERGER